MADAPEDRDISLQKASSSIFDSFHADLPPLLWDSDALLRLHIPKPALSKLIHTLEPFQESPQLLDPHLPRLLAPLTSALTSYIAAIPTDDAAAPKDTVTLPVAVSRLLYTLTKIRGYKVISRFLPNEPRFLEPVCALFSVKATGVDESWELRYILLLWLGLLVLAPFDLATISDESVEDESGVEDGLEVEGLPALSRRILNLATGFVASPSVRESEAAALVLIRICLRRDMRALGLLEKVVEWGVGIVATTTDGPLGSQLFRKTGILIVLAGILAQGESAVVGAYAHRMLSIVQQLENAEGEEWKSTKVRQLGMKIYRWVAILSLTVSVEGEDVVEDIVERLLNSLGDRDTAVRLGASKSLAVVARKLDPEMAGDMLEAVMGVYDEDVFYNPPIAQPGQKRQKVLNAVVPEKWHGATLTLAMFLRQRAVRSTEVLQRVVGCVIEALSFEQRRATFALGSNVRDAACYAIWSLARSYTTAELHAAGDIVVESTAFENGRKIPQILATELVTAGCLDPLGNVRRAASAALQELVGRHPNCVEKGIELVQTVDYSSVALRRRAVIDVSKTAAALGTEYWRAIMFGIVQGWRGVGSSDDEGRKLAARALGASVSHRFSTDKEDGSLDRTREILAALIERALGEGAKDVEIYHCALWTLAELLDGAALPTSFFTATDITSLHTTIFAKLRGREFVNPVLRPELTAEACSRYIRSLCALPLPPPAPYTLLRWTAILDAALDRTEDNVLTQCIPAFVSFFPLLTQRNQKSLTTSWSTKTTRRSHRNRGHVLALGAISSFLPDAPIHTLLSAATADAVELRVAGIQALAAGIFPSPAVPEIALQTLLAALDDYATDTRGDIGSWVRTAAIAAVADHHRVIPDSLIWAFTARLVRIAVEKLDRLRIQACDALYRIASSRPELHLGARPALEEFSTSDTRYFTHMLRYLAVSQVREAVLEGIVTSAGAGSDSLLRASRKALWTWVYTHPTMRFDFSGAFVSVLERCWGNERLIVPLLEVMGVALELGLLVGQGVGKRVFMLVQKAHVKTSNVGKLRGAVRVYRGVCLDGDEEVRRLVWRKLCAMLLHPFPRVRVEVAEALLVVWQVDEEQMGLECVESVVWDKGTKELKSAVEVVRRAVGVV